MNSTIGIFLSSTKISSLFWIAIVGRIVFRFQSGVKMCCSDSTSCQQCLGHGLVVIQFGLSYEDRGLKVWLGTYMYPVSEQLNKVHTFTLDSLILLWILYIIM